MMEPRIGTENMTWFVVLYVAALAAGGSAMAIVLTLRGVGRKQQRWFMVPLIGVGFGLLFWLFGFSLWVSISSAAAAGAVFLVAHALADTGYRAVERPQERSRE